MKHLFILVTISAALLSIGCGGDPNTSGNSDQQSTVVNAPVSTPKAHFRLEVVPQKSDSKGVVGDVYDLKMVSDSSLVPDSVRFLVDGRQVAAFSTSASFSLDTRSLRVGSLRLSAEAVYEGNTEYHSSSLTLKSDVSPKRLKYKVLKRFPHDRSAYTQGLVFDNGILYESTGLNGRSSLRKVDLERGSILQSFSLGESIFGEGLAIDGDRLIQITWKNHKGFVYDKNTFALIQEFDVPTEGWGLVLNNDTLLMTDGTENLYFVDKRSFATIKTIQVYDDQGPVKMLNELEMVDGLLYANIYQSDLVAVIDVNTGKVLNYIDFAGILPLNQYQDNTDVLNGIAYDAKSRRLFVTGKNWPLLFQVTVQ